MIIFADTSALFAVLDRDEGVHAKAVEAWISFLRGTTILHTTNYVLLETGALLQRRLGLAALRTFHDEVVPSLCVEWISEEVHRRGVDATLIAARRKLSIVDCVSFQVMRQHQITTAFTLDGHFREQGFTVVP